LPFSSVAIAAQFWSAIMAPFKSPLTFWPQGRIFVLSGKHLAS
jgi:hypothetical protein